MGLWLSKQKKALNQAKAMRDNLYNRVDVCKRNYEHAFHQISEELKRKILQSSAREISDMLDNKQVTALQVLYIFIERTMKVGIANNYVFDQMFEQAIAQAFACDQQRARDQYKKKCWRPGMNQENCYPPFYGVPTSIKQTIVMKGRQVHAGFVQKINPVSDHDSLFVVMIRKMGFIPFVRSNVPQACKTLQTNNNIFGYCLNPWNKKRSCGGSSGGESGMVSALCSPIGFGSDIGGSLRGPAVFTGLVSLKAHQRYSRLGNAYYGKFTGGLPLKSQLGPVTKNVEDTILVHNYLYNPQNYNDVSLQLRDPYVVYTQMNMKIINQKQKFKIGVAKRLLHARSCKSIQRAIDQTVQILRRKGHELVQVNLGKIQKIYFFFVNLFLFDQNLYLFKQFKGDEPLTVQYKLVRLIGKIPWIIRRILMWILKKKQPRLVQMIKSSRPLTATQVFQKIYEIEKIIFPQIYKVFASNKLDAVLLPQFATPAPLLGQVGRLQYFFSFATAWNYLGYPAGTIPITTVRANETDFHDDYNDSYTKSIRQALKGSEGLPVGIQFVSTPRNQEKILYLMKQIEQQVKFSQKHHIPQ